MALVHVRLGIPSIHCPTCVSHIESLLQPPLLSPASTSSVAVSVLDHTVSFEIWLDEADYATAQRRVEPVLVLLHEGGYETESIEMRRVLGGQAPSDHEPISSSSTASSKEHLQTSTLEDTKSRDSQVKEEVLDDQLRTLSRFDFRYGDKGELNDDLGDLDEDQKAGAPSLYKRLFRPRHARRLQQREQRRKEQQRRWQRHVEACEACRSQSDLAHQQRKAESSSAPQQQQQQQRLQVELAIGGMSCASCAGHVKSAADNVAGVLDIEVNVMSGSAVAILESESTTEPLFQAIEDAGFDVSLTKSTTLICGSGNESGPQKGNGSSKRWQATFSVHGMTCASCVGNVSKLIEANKSDLIPDGKGIVLESFDVSLFQNSAVAVLQVEPSSETALRTVVEKMAETIEDAGYDCAITDIAESREQKPNQQNQQRGQQGQEGAEKRSLDILLDGMFCQFCVDKVKRHVEQLVQSGLVECKLDRLSLSHPRLTITYTPRPPTHTIRSILAGLNSIDPNTFQARLAPSFGSDASSATAGERFAQRELRLLLIRLVLAFLFVPPTLLVAVIVPTFLSSQHPLRQSLTLPIWGRTTRADIILWALATPVQFGVGSIFYTRAFKSLRTTWSRRGNRSWIDRTLRWGDMNVLVALGTSVAYFASLVFLFVDASMSVPSDNGMTSMSESMLYFDTSVFLVFFILLGRVLEAWSKRKTTSDVAALGALRPTAGLLIIKDGDSADDGILQTEKVDVSLLEIGDEVLVPVGSSPPLDGIVVAADNDGSSTATEFDESALTGESRGVPKSKGDVVHAGTAHLGASASSTSTAKASALPCRVQITARSGSCIIDGLVDAVRAAASKRAPLQAIADTLVGYFVPAIVGLSLLVLCVWTILLYAPTGVKVPGSDDGDDEERQNRFLYALQFAVSVLVVACPCGIGLAVPAAQMAGVGVASRHGVLARGGGPALARAAKFASSSSSSSRAMVFDKTGTITRGAGGASVEDALFLGATAEDGSSQGWHKDQVWELIRSVEGYSSHPIAQTVAAWCSSQLLQEKGAEKREDSANVDGSSVEEVTGRGIKAKIVDAAANTTSTIFIGSARFMKEESIINQDRSAEGDVEAVAQRWQGLGGSVVYAGVVAPSSESDGNSRASLLALFHVADSLRPEAKEVLATLRERYLAKKPESTWIVSGDAPATVEGVASRAGVLPHCAVGGVMPLDKAKWVQRLQHGQGQASGEVDIESQIADADDVHDGDKETSKTTLVAFVGDGINDAPALASADLSIALGSGSVLASTTADFVLLTSEEPLVGILTILSLAKRTHFTMLAGFAWACAFNAALIPLAAGVLVPTGFTLGPSWSGLAMALSSCSVVLNALTLRLWTPPRRSSSH